MNMINNKKGFIFTVPLALFIIVLLAGTVAIISFMVSDAMKFILIGVAMLVGFFILLSNVMTSTVTAPKIAILLIVLAVGIGFIFSANVLNETLSYDSVYKQNWGHYCCVQHFDYDIDFERYADDVSLSICDDYTNECRYEIRPDRDPGFGDIVGYYAICDKDGNNCGSKIKFGWDSWFGSADDKEIVTIDVGRSIKFTPAFLNDDLDMIIWNKLVKTFYIKGQEDGKVYTQESCVLSSELRDKTLSDGKNELLFDECQNYMIDFIKVATQTYEYNNQEVICQSRQLYEIDNLQFKDGSTNKVQGEQIKPVACCPAENNCDSNTFNWIEDKIRECTYSSECPYGGDPQIISLRMAEEFDCINNICIPRQFEVECSHTAECIEKYGIGYVCDFALSNFGKCKVGTEVNYCGDGICQPGETANNCPIDCSDRLTCDRWWEEESIASSTDYGTLYWRFFVGNPITTSETICKTAGWVYAVVAAGVIIFIVFMTTIFFLIITPKNGKKKKKKK